MYLHIKNLCISVNIELTLPKIETPSVHKSLLFSYTVIGGSLKYQYSVSKDFYGHPMFSLGKSSSI